MFRFRAHVALVCVANHTLISPLRPKRSKRQVTFVCCEVVSPKSDDKKQQEAQVPGQSKQLASEDSQNGLLYYKTVRSLCE
jgi:hypothetical protein